MAKFYYQTVSYDISDLCLQAPNKPHGPFQTAQERDDDFRNHASGIDLETSETLAVSFFMVQAGLLKLERSFIAEWEGDPIP